jgi:3-hydroxyisobutyrate dehydrogenase-like beta-hydroxyacid dehydrogenase
MRIALIGLGEVGRALAEDLAGHDLTAWDVKFSDSTSIPCRNASALGIELGSSAVAAITGAELVISAVTAANDLLAAEAVAPGIASGAFFLDLNSASPGQKQASAAAIDGAGGRYVEAAVMSPIHPKRIASPMLLGGPHAGAFSEIAAPLGFAGIELFAAEVGKASATKMCRSVVIKGVEALLTESMLAARAYGVEDRVLATLSNLLPSDDWEKLAAYMISRALEHGERRAEEMREAARTVAETGIEPLMATATAARQDFSARFPQALAGGTVAGMVDAIRLAMSAEPARPIDISTELREEAPQRNVPL